MHLKYIPSFIAAALLSFGSCSSPTIAPNAEQRANSTANTVPDSLIKACDSLAVDIWENLKGASLSDTIRVIELRKFSNPVKRDTFMVKVNPGQINLSQSAIVIKTAEGWIIYTQVFQTRHFARNVVEDILSGNKEKDLAALVSLTKDEIANSARKSADAFFQDIKGTRHQMEIMPDAGQVRDKELYEKVMSDTTMEILCVMDFEAEEGGCYIAYSEKDQKAVPIACGD